MILEILRRHGVFDFNHDGELYILRNKVNITKEEKKKYNFCFICGSILSIEYNLIIVLLAREALLPDEFVPLCCFCHSLLYNIKNVITIYYNGNSIKIELIGADGQSYTQTIDITDMIRIFIKYERRDIIEQILEATEEYFSYSDDVDFIIETKKLLEQIL